MDFAKRPLHFFLLLPGVPSRDFWNRGGSGSSVPASLLTGGESKVGEEQEEVTGYLGVVLARRRAAGGVLSTGAVHDGGRRQSVAALR